MKVFLNQGMDQIITLLREMEKLPLADKESVQYAVVQIEEVGCDMIADFAEKLTANTLTKAASGKRREFEKKWRDPDDVCIDVERREEERKKRGLPLCVVGNILPRSAIAQAEERWEPEQERKKGRSLWAETFDDELTDIFVLQVVLQDAISEQVAQALSVELSKEDKTRLVKLYAKHKSLPAFA